MHRKWQLWALAGAGLVVAGGLWQASFSGAQNLDNGGRGRVADSPLPIRQVVLFNSGVSYFQREGEISGDSQVELALPAKDVNDLLKSLVLQDAGGGKVTSWMGCVAVAAARFRATAPGSALRPAGRRRGSHRRPGR